MSLSLRKHNIPIGIIMASILMLIMYYSMITPLVQAYFNNESPSWFEKAVESMYPRLEVEKNRLPAFFFLEKASQVIWRLSCILLVFASIIFYYQRSQNFKSRINKYLDFQLDNYKTRLINIVFFTFLIITSHDWLTDFRLMYQANAFYKPSGMYLLLPFPTPIVADLLIIAMWCSAVLSIFRIKVQWTALVATGLFILLQGYFQCFEKTDHAYVTFIYAGIGLVIYHWTKQKLWPILLVQVVITLCYLMAGLEKLLISHFSWASSETMAAYLSLHPTEIGEFILDIPWLLSLIPILVLAFQILFPLIFLPRLKKVFLISGIIFHLSTVWIMDIGSYFHPWIVVYIFFLVTPKASTKA